MSKFISRLSKKYGLVLVALGILLLNSCKSHDEPYYADKAVNKARTLALRELKFLTPNQLSFIEFREPIILTNEILTPTNYVESHQICMAWHVPGLKKSVVVFGTGTIDLSSWTPYQVLLEEFEYRDVLRDNASMTAVRYVMNQMLFLTDAERNLVRFSTPELRITDFDISTSVKLVEEDAYAREQMTKDFEGYQQVSVIWQSFNKDEVVVVTGLANKSYGDWTAITGVLCSKKELFNHTLKLLTKDLKEMTP